MFDASFNLIRYVYEIEFCSTIKRLNLSHNKIEDIDKNLVSLSLLGDLEELDLESNPIQNHPDYNELLKKYFSLDKLKFSFTYNDPPSNELNKSFSFRKITNDSKFSFNNKLIIVNLFENVDLFKGTKTDMRSPCKTYYPLNSEPNSSLSNSNKKNTKNTLLKQSTIQGLKSIISTRNSNDDSNMSYKNNIKITETEPNGFARAETEPNGFVREKSLKVFPSKMLRRNPESKIMISSINKNKKFSVLKLDEIALKVKIRRLTPIE